MSASSHTPRVAVARWEEWWMAARGRITADREAGRFRVGPAPGADDAPR